MWSPCAPRAAMTSLQPVVNWSVRSQIVRDAANVIGKILMTQRRLQVASSEFRFAFYNDYLEVMVGLRCVCRQQLARAEMRGTGNVLKFWRSGFGRLLAMLVVCAGLASCVTTETGGFNDKKDPKKAVELSVQAARNYIRDGNWEAAKRHLKTALEIDDNNAEAHESLAQVFWMTGEIEQADVHYRRSIALDSSNSRTRNNYAAYLYQQKRYKDAASQLEVVAQDLLYDRRAGAFQNLGMARMKLKDYAGAKQALERAQLMERGNVPILLQLAEVNFRLGEFAKSQELYEVFRKDAKQQTPGSLWLGVRLADKFGDNNAKSSYALALKNLYPRSDEYLEYVSVYGNDGTK